MVREYRKTQHYIAHNLAANRAFRLPPAWRAWSEAMQGNNPDERDPGGATPPRTPDNNEQTREQVNQQADEQADQRADEQARRAQRQQRWQELTSPQMLLLLGAGVLAFAGLGMPVPHLHWLIGAGLGAGLFYAPRLPRFGVRGSLFLIALGAALLGAAVAWLPHGFLPEAAPNAPPPPNPIFLDDEVYPRKAFEIVVAGAAALMHGVMVLAWNLWGRGKD